MGTVYRVREVSTGRWVALKALRSNLFDHAAARERFAREIRTMATLDHPNLVPVYHAGEYQGVPYFTMKYMTGGTVGKAILLPMPMAKVVELLRGVADGVAVLHAQGILHRDLKPSNILLDDFGVPHVADFGLAKWLDEDEHTQSGLRNGTPPYMSPEQVAGRSRGLTPSCDVWAIGVIGYEWLTGHRPFPAVEREELFRSIREDTPPSPADLVPGVSPRLAAIVLKCLNKDPLRRYPSAAEVRNDLDRFRDNLPIEADAEQTVTVEPPVVHRRTFLRALLGTGAAAVLGGGGYLLVRRHPPQSPPPVPFAERVIDELRQRKTVELIGETGSPEWWEMFPPKGLLVQEGTDGWELRLNPDGPQSFPVGFLELFPAPLPVPYRLEAELRYLPGKTDQQTAIGVYLGRRAWGNGDWHTACVARHEPPAGRVPELFRLGLVVRPPVTHWRDDLLFVEPHKRPASLPPFDPNQWMRLAIEWRDGIVRGEFLNPPVPLPAPQPLTSAVLSKQLVGYEKSLVAMTRLIQPMGVQPDLKPPAFAGAEPLGDGLGVYVRAAGVAVRRVRLVPLSPP
jgi:hypothetical protein